MGKLGSRCSSYDTYIGDCQNYGPFLDPDYNTAPNFLGVPKKGPHF